MRTIAILPIKSFDAAKQRLGSLLGGGARRALAQAMFGDTLSSLRRVEGLDAIAVITADRSAEAAALAERVTVVTDTAKDGQSPAARLGIAHALERGFERVLLVPGDTPLLSPGEVDGLLERAAEDEMQAVIAPDRHETGTNALLITPPAALGPSFGPGSRERHEELARAAGLRHRVELVPSLMHDVDTPDDLAVLWSRLDECRACAPRTRGTLRQLERSLSLRAALDARRPVAQEA